MSSVPMASDWSILLEYEIPRRQKRPDALLLAGDLVFVVEFKVGAEIFEAAARWQSQAYARDLCDFHGNCHGRHIVPILVCTEASSLSADSEDREGASVLQCADAGTLAATIAEQYQELHDPKGNLINADDFEAGPYRPTLTILEAAEHLFASHDIREIAHCYADNLTGTTDRLIEEIQSANALRTRTICFVTGVPGAGKTLAGLNAAHNPAIRKEGRPGAVFLSGNVPLIKIVRAALVESASRRGENKVESKRKAETYVQNVHSFLSTHSRDDDVPYEHAVIFDEAQRAWDADKCRSKDRGDCSEPETMLRIMSRCPDWCVIVALVGGGQEIHQGEAGLREWGRALAVNSQKWRVVVSPHIAKNQSKAAAFQLFSSDCPANVNLQLDERLHLNVNLRSYRAQAIAEWVDLVLRGDATGARRVISEISDFPLQFTRDLNGARGWLRAFTPPDRRCGLVGSSDALRLRHYGIELSSGFRQGINYENWFLKPFDDFRSSHSLESAMSEFEVQGLELDYVGVCWGNDFSFDAQEQSWTHRKLSGAKFRRVKADRSQDYIRNKYRVLLTRAREGMVIWIPRGVESDATLSPSHFDGTAEFLHAAGVPEFNWPNPR